MDTFDVPAGLHESELEIKRSTFITCIQHTPGVDAAKTFLAQIRARYADANHHCYAYIAGAPDDVFQIDKGDDGEPHGTAGKPMLNVLQHAGVGEITAVVTRYFGGIKLGAGGLVRAYTQSVSTAMMSLPTRPLVRRVPLGLRLPYALVGSVEHWLGSTDIEVVDQSYGAEVTLILAVPAAEAEKSRETLHQLCQGAAQWFTPEGDD